jgi:hypothetical protein
LEIGQVRWAGRNTGLYPARTQDQLPSFYCVFTIDQVRENETGGVFVEGLKTVDVADPSEVGLL